MSPPVHHMKHSGLSKCKVKLLQNNLNPKYHLNQACFHFAELYFQTSSYEVHYKKEENKKTRRLSLTVGVIPSFAPVFRTHLLALLCRAA